MPFILLFQMIETIGPVLEHRGQQQLDSFDITLFDVVGTVGLRQVFQTHQEAVRRIYEDPGRFVVDRMIAHPGADLPRGDLLLLLLDVSETEAQLLEPVSRCHLGERHTANLP